ncbi:antitoxin [Pseudonocardia kunmingensis]|nr:antitoxin [Pseudonocardia kunmingensis]
MPLMTDILIRDVAPDVVAALDDQARRLGLSRAEYLKRELQRAAVRPTRPVTEADLAWFGDAFADLADPDVMGEAWE